MEIGMIGLGRMGANMAMRLLRAGHKVVGYARHESTVQGRLKEGAISSGATSLANLVNQLPNPRAIWLMIPAASVDHTLYQLIPYLKPAHVLAYHANSPHHNNILRPPPPTEPAPH